MDSLSLTTDKHRVISKYFDIFSKNLLPEIKSNALERQ
tara:strand:+ start:363 stop:476 length:114 start_codon:yes stop_codon:yes gene_type:complete